jgi:hypothetical protein
MPIVHFCEAFTEVFGTQHCQSVNMVNLQPQYIRSKTVNIRQTHQIFIIQVQATCFDLCGHLQAFLWKHVETCRLNLDNKI